MALLGNLYDFESMFNKSEALQILYNYLLDAMNENSYIHHRIINLNCNDTRVENKIDIGFGIIAIEQSYKLGNGGEFESHNNFVDFQLLISGSEYMEFGSIRDFDIASDYDITRDVIFYHKHLNVSKALLNRGSIIVFFPYDVHRGGILFSDDIVYKSVIKVPSKLLKFCF